MSPSSRLSRRRCRIRRFYIFLFWLGRPWPFEDFLYGLIKVVLIICCEMVDHAQAFTEVFQMPEAPQRDCLVYLPLQYPGLPFTEVVVWLHKGIGQEQEMVMLIFNHPQVQVVPVPVIVRRRRVLIFLRRCLHDGIAPFLESGDFLFCYPLRRAMLFSCIISCISFSICPFQVRPFSFSMLSFK